MPFRLLRMGEEGLPLSRFNGSFSELAAYALKVANQKNSGILMNILGKGQLVDLTPPLKTDPVYQYTFQVSQSGTVGTLRLTPRYSDAHVGEMDAQGKVPITPGVREEKLGPSPLTPAAVVASARTMSVYNIVWLEWDLALAYLTSMRANPN